MADVEAVPAGKYGKAALEKLGVWASVEGKVAQAENVRAALELVSTGEAPLGIVYQTDAKAEPRRARSSALSRRTPIRRSSIRSRRPRSSKDPDTPAFLKCLQSAKAKELFEAQGFTVLAPVASN